MHNLYIYKDNSELSSVLLNYEWMIKEKNKFTGVMNIDNLSITLEDVLSEYAELSSKKTKFKHLLRLADYCLMYLFSNKDLNFSSPMIKISSNISAAQNLLKPVNLICNELEMIKYSPLLSVKTIISALVCEANELGFCLKNALKDFILELRSIKQVPVLTYNSLFQEHIEAQKVILKMKVEGVGSGKKAS
jgi:hypothetical protein